MFFIFSLLRKDTFLYNIIFRTSCKSVGFAFISSVIFLFIDCFTSQSHANPTPKADSSQGTQSEGGQSSRDAERMTKNFSHAIYFYFFEIYYKFNILKLLRN